MLSSHHREESLSHRMKSPKCHRTKLKIITDSFIHSFFHHSSQQSIPACTEWRLWTGRPQTHPMPAKPKAEWITGYCSSRCVNGPVYGLRSGLYISEISVYTCSVNHRWSETEKFTLVSGADATFKCGDISRLTCWSVTSDSQFQKVTCLAGVTFTNLV